MIELRREQLKFLRDRNLSKEWNELEFVDFFKLQGVRILDTLIDFESLLEPNDIHDHKNFVSILGPDMGLWDDYVLARSDRLAIIDGLHLIAMRYVLSAFLEEWKERYSPFEIVECLQEAVDTGALPSVEVREFFKGEMNDPDDAYDYDFKLTRRGALFMLLKMGVLKSKAVV